MDFLQFSSTEEGLVEIIVDGNTECYISIEDTEIVKADLICAIDTAKEKKAAFNELQKQKLQQEISDLEQKALLLKQKLANL